MYYGRIESDKHIETVINACKILKSKGKDFHLNLVGDYMEEYKEHLIKQINQLGLQHYITFHGHVPFHEKRKYFDNSDLFLFSTCGTEGFPRVIWESYSFGLPVIAAKYPGADLFFNDYEHLIFFERKNAKQLSEKILEACNKEELRIKLAEGGRKLLLNNTLEKGHKHMSDIIISEVNQRINEKLA